MDIEADVWAEGEQDLLQEIAALSGALEKRLHVRPAHPPFACS